MTASMLAAVYYGAKDFRLEQRPIPAIQPDEALLKVVSTGICGTDLRIFNGAHRKYTPDTIRIPGHEVVGDIVKVGEQIKDFQSGQRVFVAPNSGCGKCAQCISGNNNLCLYYQAPGITYDGSFAEFMRIPAELIDQGNLIPIDQNVDPAAAALIEPFACVLRGQDALRLLPGDNVLIVGAGPIGIMHTMLARLSGAGLVIVSEVNPTRLEQARKFGADLVLNPSAEDLKTTVTEVTNGRMMDVVIVAAPAPEAQEMALELAAIKGRINFFGGLPKDKSQVYLDANLVHYRELVVTGTTACSTEDCWRAARIVNSGQIDLSKIVGSKYPLAEIHAAIEKAHEGTALKVVIEP